jgi:glycosyltransferase involved in cell wall biosynthesis
LFRSQFFGYIIKRYFFPDIKLIFHEHGPLGSGFEGYFVTNLLRFSRKYLDCSIAVSNNVKKQLIMKGKIDSKIIKILNNFIVYADNEKNQRLIFRKKHNIEDKTFVVGYAARLVPGKGWSDLIKILDSIKNKNILVLLAGTGPDKKKLEKIIEMKSDSLVNIKYIGYISNMREFYAGVDCFVIPSRAEAFGLTALEAQAAGVPVVASDIPGLNEVINWGNALLFPVKNSTLLACQINALEHSKALRTRLIKNGYANIKRFEKDIILEKLNQLYNNL